MRILIADDHPLYREAVATQIKRLYQDAIIDETATLDSAIAAARGADVDYDLLLIDFHMPGVSEGSISGMVSEFSDIPVAIISGTANIGEIRTAITCGVRGFIPKTASADYLSHAIQILLAGGTSIPVDVLTASSGLDLPDDKSPSWRPLLTSRELEVLSAVARGISNKEIGRELNLAEVTVKLHLRSIFRKIGARSRAEAAVIATKSGLA